jgi:hypothetical protein
MASRGIHASPKILIPAQSASVIAWFRQCGLDVIFERGRHPRSCRDDPAQASHRDDRQEHVGDLVLGRAHRKRTGSAPLQQTADDPMATATATCSNAAVLASSAGVSARRRPNPASTNPSSKIASLRRISWNLAAWLIRRSYSSDAVGMSKCHVGANSITQ